MDTSNNQEPVRDTEAFRDSIATVDKTGKRNWIFPKKPKGRFYNARTYFSWLVLAFLFIAPFVKIGDEQFLLFNILKRKFVLFGVVFTPQDFHIFVFAMLIFIVFIILFTVVYGRVFCGWACPQTIFMEMVFRKIEYLIDGDSSAQRKLAKAPWTSQKIFKRILKNTIFFAISFFIANIFLSYIISMDELKKIISEPVAQHLGGFIAILIFSGVFYFVFAWMREQVCIAVCPYGRLQGVMLDQSSIVVAYDFIRGEPRGKKKKSKVPEAVEVSPLGDCIDCKLCVQVCPTGIDIRNGTQLECVNCTACIDACDEVMDKIDRPRGLIRYDSRKGIEEGNQKILTTRVKAYSTVLIVLLLAVGVMFSFRTNVEAIITQVRGTKYQEVGENQITNFFMYDIVNKIGHTIPAKIRMKDDLGTVEYIGNSLDSIYEPNSTGRFSVTVDKKYLKGRKTKLILEVVSEGKVITTEKINFVGPYR